MLTRRLIPTLLLRQGRLVKGVRYGEHRDAGNPPSITRAHAAQDADEVLLVDIDASREGRAPDFTAFAKVAEECTMPLTLGGGLINFDLAQKAMNTGADKLAFTGPALDNPALLDAVARRFGAQAVVLGLDILQDETGTYSLYDYRTGTIVANRTPTAWAKEAVDRGAGEIRLMAVHREGTRLGFDLDLYRLIADAVSVPIILEGGAGTLDHLDAAMAAGVEALGLGTMLVFSDNNIVKLRQYLLGCGHVLRR